MNRRDVPSKNSITRTQERGDFLIRHVERYLTGYGLAALYHALTGMGDDPDVQIDNVKTLYLAADDYDTYVANGLWRMWLEPDAHQLLGGQAALDYLKNEDVLVRVERYSEESETVVMAQMQWYSAIVGPKLS